MSSLEGAAPSGRRYQLDESALLYVKLAETFWLKGDSSAMQQLEGLKNYLAEEPQTRSSVLRAPVEALVENLTGALEVLELPYELLGKAHSLEPGGPTPIVNLIRRGISGEVSESAFYAELEGLTAAGDTVTALRLQAENAKVYQSLVAYAGSRHFARLMHQGCLLIWSAYETFCKEAFTAGLNAMPLLVAKLKVEPWQSKFGFKNLFSFDLLAANGFSIEGKLGSIIVAGRDFSSPELLRDLMPTLFAYGPQADEMTRALRAQALYMLGHRRHLIAHRCGIVDSAYLSQTGDSPQEVGQLLKVSHRDIATALGSVAHAVIQLTGVIEVQHEDRV